MATCMIIDGNLNVRECFKLEALDSWAEFQKNGLHLTGNEVRIWLNTWGSEAEMELPLCHS